MARRQRSVALGLLALLVALHAACELSLRRAFVAGLGLSPRRSAAPAHTARWARGGETVAASEISPLGNYLLLRLGKPEEVSKGGIVLPGKQKPNQGDVVAVGPGELNEKTGETEPVSVATGTRVIYSQSAYFDKFELDGVEHALLPEDEILLAFTGEELTVAGIAMPRDRVLVRVAEKKQETDAGLFLSKAAAEKGGSSVGEVLAVGDGVEAVAVGEGVKFRYGDEVAFSSGTNKDKYMSVRAEDCIAKAPAVDKF